MDEKKEESKEAKHTKKEVPIVEPIHPKDERGGKKRSLLDTCR
ncbi:MAG: hypothetical protein PHD41_01630 [Methanosarcinaceae archaeon]|nr:hypothetical protein [Methanosarcinaceae archaeon]MDD4332146.1 hypothetical protein [Methanosarcinaceae archaeon]MDD4748862.1 hypothetical protein [Methanosarcinaceae archaeon]